MNQEPLPQIHLIRDTDLSVFAYELHIFAGDFLRECEFNMRSLATNTGADSIAIMGKNHMWLSDALFAYCSTADLHQMILTTEFIGARAFLFHTDRSEGGHLYGDVLMMDLDTLRQDIKRNILYPCGVNIERKDGSAATVSLKEWTEMELYEKDALKSWGYSWDRLYLFFCNRFPACKGKKCSACSRICKGICHNGNRTLSCDWERLWPDAPFLRIVSAWFI